MATTDINYTVLAENVTSMTSFKVVHDNHTYGNNTDIYDTSDNGDQGVHVLPPKILALVLGFFAISLNLMSLLALSQIKNRITTHHRLIISLATSDMVIGVSVIMHFVYESVHTNYRPGYGPPFKRLQSWCTFLVIKALNSTGLNISLLNLMAMAIDHYMAIIKPLHYPAQMNKTNAYCMIAVLWILAALLGFSDFFTGFNKYYEHWPLYNYCEATYLSKYQDEFTIFAITILATVVMLFIYTRIYRKIQKHRAPGEVNPANKRLSIRSDFTRNLRALVTTLLIVGTFMICWLPNCIYQISLIIQIQIDKSKLYEWANTLFIFDRYVLDLLLLNAIADPVIYAVRMYDVQTGYRRLLKKCLPHFTWTREDSYVGTKLFAKTSSPVHHEQLRLKQSFNNRSSLCSGHSMDAKEQVSVSRNSSSSCKSGKTTVKSYESNINNIAH